MNEMSENMSQTLHQTYNELLETPGFISISSLLGNLLIQFSEKEFIELFPFHSRQPRQSYDYPTELYCDFGNIHYFAISAKPNDTCPNCGAKILYKEWK